MTDKGRKRSRSRIRPFPSSPGSSSGFLSAAKFIAGLNMQTLLAKFLIDRSGAAILEYSLIAGAVAVMLVSAMSSLGQGLDEVYQYIILALRSLN